MEIFKSSNPALSESRFESQVQYADGEVMTRGGTLNKFFLLALLVISSAAFTWSAAAQGKDVTMWMIGGAIGGLVLSLVTIFKPKIANITAPLYALCEGFFLGAISVFFANAFAKSAPGIVMQAVGLTFGVVIAMYFLYKFNVIKATARLQSIIVMSLGGIMVFYLISMVMGMVGVNLPFLALGTPLSIGIALFVVAIAALSLIMDFEMIEQGVQSRAPKYMEWYGAFGLAVTIIFLYVSILRLLANLSNRN